MAKDLRAEILKKDDKFFERLVVDLFRKIFPNESGRVTGKAGDGGIDGVILQDRFGLGRIYIQAKRYENATVPRKDVSSFCNDIGEGAGTKGFFVTLSRFSDDAKKVAAKHRAQNVVLVDGPQLLELLIGNDIGVADDYKVQVKKLNADYFLEDE